MSRIWSWFLILGVAWIWYGMFVLSYRGGQSGRGGRAGRRRLPVRRRRSAAGGKTGRDLALAVHLDGHPGRGRRDHDLRLVRHHIVCRVDPGRLVPDRVPDRASGQRPGRGPRCHGGGPSCCWGSASSSLGVWAIRSWGAVAADVRDPRGCVGHLHWDQRDLRRVLPGRRPLEAVDRECRSPGDRRRSGWPPRRGQRPGRWRPCPNTQEAP
jgi:hypothetical protein